RALGRGPGNRLKLFGRGGVWAARPRAMPRRCWSVVPRRVPLPTCVHVVGPRCVVAVDVRLRFVVVLPAFVIQPTLSPLDPRRVAPSNFLGVTIGCFAELFEGDAAFPGLLECDACRLLALAKGVVAPEGSELLVVVGLGMRGWEVGEHARRIARCGCIPCSPVPLFPCSRREVVARVSRDREGRIVRGTVLAGQTLWGTWEPCHAGSVD